jgi:sterol O-acyltransferase
VLDDDDDGTIADDSSNGFDDEKMESYDDLKVDPDTLIGTRRSMDDGYRRSSSFVAGKDTRSDSEPVASTGSIPIRLESTDRQGHYLLTADDPEIREILRKGIEREEIEAGRSKPPRLRVRDLVFTRQFTTFDRRHAAAAESPFFGFFTLFWICMSLVFV